MNKIVVANWKMNPSSQKEAEVLFKESYSLAKNIKNTQIIICPPSPFLFIAKKFKNKKVMLGSQNVSTETEGSYTGEVSPLMLKNMGVSYVIIGHGERRRLGETNKIVNTKILNSLKFKLFQFYV